MRVVVHQLLELSLFPSLFRDQENIMFARNYEFLCPTMMEEGGSDFSPVNDIPLLFLPPLSGFPRGDVAMIQSATVVEDSCWFLVGESFLAWFMIA